MTFSDIVFSIINTILGPLSVLMIGLALVLFFWGLVIYVQSEATSGKGKGRSLMFWGVIVIFVMVSVWGLVNLIRNTIPGMTDRNLHAIPSRR